MYVPFESLPGHSRLWVYQSDKKFTIAQKHIISDTLRAFVEEWMVHGQPMHASFDIGYDQFITLAADEQVHAASGCSIDGSVRAITALGQALEIDFFNRVNIAFRKENETVLIPLHELKSKFEEGQWNGETLVFNNLIATKAEHQKSWLAPAGTTWLKRYLPQKEVSQLS